MKKTLKLALGALMMAGAVNAQVATLPNGYYDYEWGVLPKLFSSDGKGKLVATEYSGEGSNIKVNVYNSLKSATIIQYTIKGRFMSR